MTLATVPHAGADNHRLLVPPRTIAGFARRHDVEGETVGEQQQGKASGPREITDSDVGEL